MIQQNWPCDGCMFKGDVVEEYFADEVDLLDAHKLKLHEVGLFEGNVE